MSANSNLNPSDTALYEVGKLPQANKTTFLEVLQEEQPMAQLLELTHGWLHE